MRTRGRSLERFWARYAGSLAFVALVVIAALGFARIENARYEGCQGGNLLRAGLRETEETNIAQQEAITPSLFPDIPPATFDRLQAENRERAQYNINVRYADRPCGTRIDLPLTGAAIVLPP
jgi:hypothetical protein